MLLDLSGRHKSRLAVGVDPVSSVRYRVEVTVVETKELDKYHGPS